MCWRAVETRQKRGYAVRLIGLFKHELKVSKDAQWQLKVQPTCEALAQRRGSFSMPNARRVDPSAIAMLTRFLFRNWRSITRRTPDT
jgi:hypothetical protein